MLLRKTPKRTVTPSVSGTSRSSRSANRATAPRVLFTNVADLAPAPSIAAGNEIRTTKYNPWTFLFVFLWNQFTTAFANFFFLFQAVVNCLPWTHVYDYFSTWAPLCFVLVVSFIRELIEHIGRSRADKAVNTAPVTLFRNGRVVHGAVSADIRCGDIVLVRKDEAIPADLILAASADPAGTAYVQTANLDGEINLKLRRAVALTHKHVTTARTAAHGTSPRGTSPRGALAPGALPSGVPEAVASLHLATTVSPPSAMLEQVSGNVLALTLRDVESYGPDGGLDGDASRRRRQAARLITSGGLEGAEDPAYFDVQQENDVNEMPHQGNLIPNSAGAEGETDGLLITPPPAATPSPIPVPVPVLDSQSITDRTTPLTPEQLLLRGCLFKSSWGLGIVVGCGHESKIMLNSAGTPNKISDLTRKMNKGMVVIFIVHFVICVVTASAGVIQMSVQGGGRWYMGAELAKEPSSIALFLNFLIFTFSFYSVYSCMVPVSLFVSIEVSRAILSKLIQQDKEFKLEGAGDERNFTVRSGSLLEEIGYLQYVFTDKTGTLTENLMIADTFWTPASGAWRTECQILRDATSTTNHAVVAENEGAPALHDDLRLVRTPENGMEVAAGAATGDRAGIDRLMVALALCHTATVDTSANDANDDPTAAPTAPADISDEVVAGMVYSAESPDEAALVNLAAQNGAALVTRSDKEIWLRALNQSEHSAALDEWCVDQGKGNYVGKVAVIFPFNSDRKRMSILFEAPDGYVLVTKGADSAVLPRCSASTREQCEAALRALDTASSEGLRTLVVATKRLTADVGADIVARFKMASSLASAQEKEEAIAQVASDAEDQGLELVGVTAIEDRLQDGVPETLSFLREAGIRPWMLTGDKLQTAINIGHSAQLLAPGQPIIKLLGQTITSDDDAREALNRAAAEIERVAGQVNYSPVQMDKFAEIKTVFKNLADVDLKRQGKTEYSFEHGLGDTRHLTNPALVVDGNALTWILATVPDQFIRVASAAGAVIVCRASPKQKADCVTLMKNTGKIVAAVGDGANDVSMIQVASVGIGIAGREGLQASRCADFSIARFRYLKRLCAVHGRYNYRRFSAITQYSYYKNMAMVTTSILYSIYSGFSGVSAIDSYGLLFYNLVFTSLPIVALTIFDQDVPAFVLELVPQLYRPMQNRNLLNAKSFFVWILEGCYVGATVFLVASQALVGSGGIFRADGRTAGMALFQELNLLGLLFVVTFRVAFQARVWHWPFALTLVISLALVFVLQIMSSLAGDYLSLGIWTDLLSEGHGPLGFAWEVVLFIVGLAVLPYVLFRFAKYRWYPTTTDTIVEGVRRHNRVLGIFAADKVTAEERVAALGAEAQEEL